MTDPVTTGTRTDDDGTVPPFTIEFPQDAVDEPQLLCEELRAAIRSLR